MGGALRDKYEAWRDTLKECLAYAEAVIDFGDDEVSHGGISCLRCFTLWCYVLYFNVVI